MANSEIIRLAVLIDADNASATVAKELLEEVAKYGTATVLAMLHDVALVVGAVGISHYVALVPPLG